MPSRCDTAGEQLVEPASGSGHELNEHLCRVGRARPFGKAQMQLVPVEKKAHNTRVRRFNEPAVYDEFWPAEFVLRPNRCAGGLKRFAPDGHGAEAVRAVQPHSSAYASSPSRMYMVQLDL